MILYKGYFEKVWIDEGGNLGLMFVFKHRFGRFYCEKIDKIDTYMRENMNNLKQFDIIRNDGELILDMTFKWEGGEFNLEQQRDGLERILLSILSPFLSLIIN